MWRTLNTVPRTQSLLRTQEVIRYPPLPPAGARLRNTRPAGTRGQVQPPSAGGGATLLVPQKVASEANPKVRNHGEGPY